MPGSTGATATPASIPASRSTARARSRWRGGAVPGSVRRHTSSSSVGTEKLTLTRARSDSLSEDIDVAHDQRPPRDDVERVRGHSERLEAAAGEPVPALGRLVRVGGGADGDGLAAPGLPRELHAQHLGDVHLDADRVAVALAGRTVGPLLERPDVTERAAVDAAHVRVERPGERHPSDAVESGLARLLAVFHPHAGRIEHMFD